MGQYLASFQNLKPATHSKHKIPREDTSNYILFSWTSPATYQNQSIEYTLVMDTIGSALTDQTKIQFPLQNDTFYKLNKYDLLIQLAWVKYPMVNGDSVQLQWAIKAVSTTNGITETEYSTTSSEIVFTIPDATLQGFFVDYPTNDSLISLAGDRNQKARFQWEDLIPSGISMTNAVYFDFEVKGSYFPVSTSALADNSGNSKELNIAYGDLLNNITDLYPRYSIGDTVTVEWYVVSAVGLGGETFIRQSLNKHQFKVYRGLFLDEMAAFKELSPTKNTGIIDVYQDSYASVPFTWNNTYCLQACPGTEYTFLMDSVTSDFYSDPSLFYFENSVTDSTTNVVMGNIVAFLKTMQIGYMDTLTVKWRVTAYNSNTIPSEQNSVNDEYVTFRRVFPMGIDEISGVPIVKTSAIPADQSFDLVVSKPALMAQLYNLQGQLVCTANISSQSSENTQISFNTEALASGIYYYTVAGLKGQFSQKIVVQHP